MSVWRPFAGIPGAERVAAHLAAGETSHAWLLTGPRGSGARGVAFAMAAALVCEKGIGTGCGECSACERALRCRHSDVHHVQPEGLIIPVDVIRETVIPEAARSPFEAARKVFVLEDADRMNDAAQNALLKTLEEPQADTVFVLVSHHEEEVLETIRSRCRIVRLEPVRVDRIVALLVEAGATPEDAERAAALSDGDLDRARALAFDDEARRRLALWRSIPGRLATPLDALDAAAEILAEARAAAKAREKQQKAEVVALAEAMGEGRGTSAARNALAKRHRRELRRVEEEVLVEALDSLGAFYRDALVRRSSGDLSTAPAATDAALVAAAARCVETTGTFAYNANQTLAIEATLVDLAALLPPAQKVST